MGFPWKFPVPSKESSQTPASVFGERPRIALTSVLPEPKTPVAWVPTIRDNEAEVAIFKLERELNHDFSEKNIDAEETQLAGLKKTIKRLLDELEDAKHRQIELLSLEPHWDFCRDARRKQKFATHAGKRKRLTPEQRDEAARVKHAKEDEDCNFVDDKPSKGAVEAVPAEEA